MEHEIILANILCLHGVNIHYSKYSKFTKMLLFYQTLEGSGTHSCLSSLLVGEVAYSKLRFTVNDLIDTREALLRTLL